MSENQTEHVVDLDDDSIVPEVQVGETEANTATTQEAVKEPELDIVLDYGFTKAVPEGFEVETIDLPSKDDETIRGIVDNLPKINMASSEAEVKWVETLRNGMEQTPLRGVFTKTLAREGGKFRQYMQYGDTKLKASEPKFNEIENKRLQGERAVLRVMSHLGLGSLFSVPLVHSGFWVTFKAPTETELIELNRMMFNDKITFGRYTYGLMFGNSTAYTVDRLVNFALEHVFESTLKSDLVGKRELKSLILTQDIPTLLLGVLCTQYSRGFKYRRACVNDPEKCNHVIEELINLAELLWTDNNSLTDWQRAHMASRQKGSKDIESIKRYQEELKTLQDKHITIKKPNGSDITIKLKSPTIAEYVDAGYKWITNVVNVVEGAISHEESREDRELYIERHSQATAMRQYSHWISSLLMGTNEIEDKETIDQVLNVLSADDGTRNAYIDGILDYINTSTVSVVGIPAYDCPACGTPQEQGLNLPRHTSVIPMDLIQVFFALIGQRLEKISQR